MNDSKARSITKAVTWRVMGSGTVLLISYIVTGNLSASGYIAGAQVIISLGLYYVHERLWGRITWGRS